MPLFENVTWALDTELTAAAPPNLEFVRVDEELDEPYDIRLTASTSAVDLDIAEMLGKDATIVVSRAPLERRFCGVIQEVEAEDASPDASMMTFSLRIRPALFMLSMRRDSRIFQKKTVPEIVKEVLEAGLGPYEREMKDELEETYPTREYCVQYQETDLDFVSRLLQEEGIHYGFDHEGEKEIVVLRDKNASFAKVKTLPEEGVLPYHPDIRVTENSESIVAFQLTRQKTITKVTVRDNDFTREDLFFDDEEGGPDKLGRERESYEHGSGRSLTIYDYEQGVRRYQKDDAARQKKLRLEHHQRDAVIAYTAEGNALGLQPGTTFALRGHPTIGVDGEYVVTRVGHSMSPLQAGTDNYSNHFHCIPKETVYRPKRVAPKPRVPSIQTAIVTGPAGEEIHVDEYGRIKVQFYWDRLGEKDEKTSCWVRTQQTWAGNGFGTWWVPRVGMEVIVQFVDGDPDRPLVTGCVYNADNALPYALPDEKTKSTIKSNSTIGGGGFNEFRFEDKKGQEEIWLHAQKDLNEKVLNNHTLDVGVDETITIGSNQVQTIGANQTEHVKANQTMNVDANRTTKVGGNFSEEVVGNETRTVTGSVTETITAGETRTVNAGRTTTVNGGETKSVTGGRAETVIGGVVTGIVGARTESVVGDQTLTVSGSRTDTINGAVTTTTPATMNLNVSAQITVISGAGMRTCEPKKDNFNAFKEDFFGIGLSMGAIMVSVRGLNRTIAHTSESVAGTKLDMCTMSLGASALKTDIRGVWTQNKGIELDFLTLQIKA